MIHEHKHGYLIFNKWSQPMFLCKNSSIYILNKALISSSTKIKMYW
jgi:hypothetical protein